MLLAHIIFNRQYLRHTQKISISDEKVNAREMRNVSLICLHNNFPQQFTLVIIYEMLCVFNELT